MLPRWSLYFLALLAHALSLPGVFVFDDHSLLADPPRLAQLFHLEQTRPLTYFTFWLNGALGGWHLFNLAGHLVCVWLLDRISRRELPPAAAWIAPFLFAVHPLLSEPVQYIFARSSLLAALFCLASLDAWTRRRPWEAAAWFLPAILSKEECAAFPLILLLLPHRTWPPVLAMLAMSLAAGIRAIYATAVVAGGGSGFDAGVSSALYFLAQGQVIWGYLLRLIVPYGLTIDPPAPLPDLESGMLGWAALAVVSAIALWRAHPAGRWFVCGLILLLPSSSFLPAADLLAWRRMYLPSIAFTLAAAYLLHRLPVKAVSAVILLLATLSAARALVWRSERALWEEAAAAAPQALRPKLQLARVAPLGEALNILHQAEVLAPADPQIPTLRGMVYLQGGDGARSLAEFGKALALNPSDPRTISNRGVALAALGQNDAARQDFERALTLDPCQQQARENLTRLGGQPPPCPATD